MPKASGESLKIKHAPARAQPSRKIMHGWVPAGGKTAPTAQGAWKQFDHLTPNLSKIEPRQQRY